MLIAVKNIDQKVPAAIVEVGMSSLRSSAENGRGGDKRGYSSRRLLSLNAFDLSAAHIVLQLHVSLLRETLDTPEAPRMKCGEPVHVTRFLRANTASHFLPNQSTPITIHLVLRRPYHRQ